MGIDLTPRCAKCGKKLELSSMKALPDGKGFVCNSCFEQGKAPSSPFSVNKENLRTIPKENNISKEPKETDFVAKGDDIFDKKEYVCNSCGYKFKKGSNFQVNICPYCGKRDISQKVEENADVLLD